MTYSGDPSSSDRDRVRFEIGDTDTDNEFLTDTEIDFLLSEYGSITEATIEAAKAIATKFRRLFRYKMHGVEVDPRELAKQFDDLADSLVAHGAAQPFAGGISVADKEGRESNTDRTEPAFRRGLHDFAG